jgi:hypothetical protein
VVDNAGGPRFSAAEVVELRQNTLHPGARDTLVQVFEDHFVEGQEQVGIRIGGIFLDENDPDRFVWFRGFADLDQRLDALQSFYFGPIWTQHRDLANGTMIDSDDVLLLRPTVPAHRPPEPAPLVDRRPGEDRVHVSVYVYCADLELEIWLSTEVHRILERVLDTSVATWRSHPGPNGFTKLPVREDNAFVWTASFPDQEARQHALDRLHASPRWTADLAPVIHSPHHRPRPGPAPDPSFPSPAARHPIQRQRLGESTCPSIAPRVIDGLEERISGFFLIGDWKVACCSRSAPCWA